MGTDQERRIPIPPEGSILRTFNRLNPDPLLGSPVEADQASILGFGIDDVGVCGIDLDLEPVASDDHAPVGIENTRDTAVAGGASECEVVLGPSVDIVER